jgi:hypothetical protein
MIKEKPIGSPEPFMAGRGVVDDFRKSAGSLECRSISGENFFGWDEFQTSMFESHDCKGMIQSLINYTSEVILHYRR